MEIINPQFNSMEEQVQTNMENIKRLAGYVKEAFNATVELTPQTTTLDASNVRDWVVGTTDGFILDNSGYLFKIVAVSDNTIYVQFWSDLEGPQGIAGATGPQGPQGEQGPAGPRVPQFIVGNQPSDPIEGDSYLNPSNGKIYTYSNGSWSNIWTIPVAGAEDITDINLVVGDPTSVTYNTEDGVIVESQGTLRYNGQLGPLTKNVNIINKVPLVGSPTIVIDQSEDGQHITANLDAETVAKIDRSLVSPMSAPSATQIVAISENNEQTNLNIGTGLTVENGTLNASGGGNQKYLHKIQVQTSSYRIYLDLLLTDSTALTGPNLYTTLVDLGITSLNNSIGIMGMYAGGGGSINALCGFANPSNSNNIKVYFDKFNITKSDITVEGGESFSVVTDVGVGSIEINIDLSSTFVSTIDIVM